MIKCIEIFGTCFILISLIIWSYKLAPVSYYLLVARVPSKRLDPINNVL